MRDQCDTEGLEERERKKREDGERRIEPIGEKSNKSELQSKERERERERESEREETHSVRG